MRTTRKPAPPPSPLAPRICQCGCKLEFGPGRNDQIYLNKQHADFAYNNGIRKRKNASRIKHEKILAQNDRILEKHYKSNPIKDNRVVVYKAILFADGFDFSYHVGKSEEQGKEYHYTYRYCICLNPLNPHKVAIYKR
jgi:hypothetical protein